MKKLTALILALFLVLSSAMAYAAAGITYDAKAVTYLNAKFECGCSRTGGGALVARNCLITAAHNLVCPDHNKHLKTCEFFFNWDGSTYSGRYTGRFSYRWYADFSHGYNSQDDIAYVIFPENVADRTGFYETGVISYGEESLGWDYCTIYGYSGKKRVSDRSKVQFADSKQICWPMSSGFRNTMEGGPVLWGSSGVFLTAVYTSHDGTTGYARLLTGDIIDDMLRDGADFWQD